MRSACARFAATAQPLAQRQRSRAAPSCSCCLCRFLGCMNKECQLCANNPNKRCRPNDNFDECYADNQVLKSKCDADVFVQLLSETTGRPADMSGLEVQVGCERGERMLPGSSSGY